MRRLKTLRMRYALAAMGVSLFLAACGGGGGGSAPSDPNQPGNQPPLVRQFDPAAVAQLNTETSVDPNASEPVTGSDAAGNIITAWTQPDGQRTNVFARRFNASTQSFEDAILVGLKDGARNRDVRLKVNANGDAVAIWEHNALEDSGSEDDVMVSVYKSASNTWTTTRLTNNTQSSLADVDSNSPDVAFGPEGMIVATWRERFNDLIPGNPPPNETPPSDAFRLQSATYDPQTQSWGAPQQVTRGFPTPFFDRIEHRVAVLPNKDVVVAAITRSTENSNTEIELFRRNELTKQWGEGNFDSNGEPFGGLEGLPSASGRLDNLQLASNDKGHVQIVWRHSFDVSPGRQLIASAFLGSNTTSWVVPSQVDSTAPAPDTFGDKFGFSGKDSTQPNVVMDTNGIATFVWRQDESFENGTIEDIYTRQFDANTGQYVSEPQLIEQNPNRTNGVPALTLDAQGNVFTAWAQFSAEPNISSVYASRFDAATKAWTSPALVEADDTSTVIPSSLGLAMAPDGSAMTVWAQAKRILFNRFK
jgi:hypothetical protein